MFFDTERVKGRFACWLETLLDAINTNLPREIVDDFMSDYENTYGKRIEKPARECIAFAGEVLDWQTPHLGSFLLKYFMFFLTVFWTLPWLLLFFVLVNLETLLKIALWIGIVLPIMLLVILLVDVRLAPRTTQAEE